MNHERLIQRAKEETLKRIREDRKDAPEDVAEILEEFEKGIFGRGFAINDVRRECAPSAETLRAFRARVGSSFKSYVTERLLEAAEQLVDQPEVDLLEIAQGLGFASAALFARWFRRWTGETPEERRSVLRRTGPKEPPEGEEPLIAIWFRARVAALNCEEAALLVGVVRRQACRSRRRTYS